MYMKIRPRLIKTAFVDDSRFFEKVVSSDEIVGNFANALNEEIFQILESHIQKVSLEIEI